MQIRSRDPAPAYILLPTRRGTGRGEMRTVGRDRLSDLGYAVGTFAAGCFLIAIDLAGWSADAWLSVPRWWHAVPLAVGCAAMLVKRAHPVPALGVGAVAFAVDLAMGGSLGMLLVLWDLLYACGLFAGAMARRWVAGVVLAVVLVGAVAVGETQRDLRAFVLGLIQLGALLGVPLWWAANVRQKSELAELSARRADLEAQRAADAERIAELREQEAVQRERAAMARDLHDVVSSHVSAAALHAGAALAAPPDTERDRAALETVRASCLASLSEMRSMIMLLRADPVLAPPRLSGLADLVGAVEASGAVVHLDLPRDWQSSARELPAATDHAGYRIVQEALANATKHAPGAPVSVAVDLTDRAVLLTVANPTSGGSGVDHPALSAGTGLVSMRERAEALGGTLRAGATGDGGSACWAVTAVLPLAGLPVDAGSRLPGGAERWDTGEAEGSGTGGAEGSGTGGR